MEADTFINISTEDKVRIITINRPPVNALGPTLMGQLRKAFEDFAKDRSVKAAVLTALGSDVFVAGADLKDFGKIKNIFHGWRLTRMGQKLFSFIEGLNKPVICAINGVCLGGGNELAMSCHYRIASERAKFAQPEINLGIIPGWGGSQRLPRITGPSKATELILTGDKISAQEALRVGLVDKVVPETELLKQAVGLGRQIGMKSLVAITRAMKAIRKSLNSRLSCGLYAEARYFLETLASQDCREGIKAFLEKRQPQFKDR
jgi:enoyl-CoA hydratase/carnithine racemase